MPASRERDLARALAAVLDGVEPAVGEAGALASVLSRAAASARIDVPEAEVERALARSRPREATRARKRRVRLGLVLAGAAAAAAAVVALVILSPFSRAPGLDVTARAAQALGAADTVLAVTERVRPAEEGAFQESARLGWLDLSEGRAHWTLQVGGRRVAETLVEPGEVRHFLPYQNVVIEASSCAAFATGCSRARRPDRVLSGSARRRRRHRRHEDRGRRPACLPPRPARPVPTRCREDRAGRVHRRRDLSPAPVRVARRAGPGRAPTVRDHRRRVLEDPAAGRGTGRGVHARGPFERRGGLTRGGRRRDRDGRAHARRGQAAGATAAVARPGVRGQAARGHRESRAGRRHRLSTALRRRPDGVELHDRGPARHRGTPQRPDEDRASGRRGRGPLLRGPERKGDRRAARVPSDRRRSWRRTSRRSTCSARSNCSRRSS